MFCSRCGSEVEDKVQFCPTCGLELRPRTTPVQAIATGDVTEQDLVQEALGAEYEILEELGRGGMAIVYRAREKQLDREVAIKVLPFSLAFDAEFVERFQREARTAAQLEHPNIIPIYRVGKSGRVIYFVMKLLKGRALSSLLLERRRLGTAEIRRLLMEAGNALGYAAKRGIVHRDIKPDNIMFDEFGQCVIADFGIAKAASGQRLTGTGMSIGTPHYMSPEQARAQSIDGRSDIYSLGIVAYQCLVGEVPFDGEDSFAIGYKHIMEPIPTPSLSTPEEKRMFEVIRRMIMKDPRDRFQDADELIHALEGQPISPHSPSARMTASRLAGMAVQPTTPIPGLADLKAPAEDVASRRPIGRRSAVRRQASGGMAWLWILLLLLAGGGGAYYYRFVMPGHAGTSGGADSAAVQHDTGAGASSTASPTTDTAALHNLDSVAIGPPQIVSPSLPRRDSAIASPGVPPHPRDSIVSPKDSGGLRVMGLPKGSTVLIDARPVFDPVIHLSAGLHELAITAPGFDFYKDTVEISPGQILSVTPELPRFGEPPPPRLRRPPLGGGVASCDFPNQANRFGRACYDEAPRPLGSTRLPLPPEVEGTPNPAVFVVKVSTEGRSLRVHAFKSSGDAAFDKAAESLVLQLQWRPATKGGTAVDGWTQLAVQPGSR